jgi:ABC-type proline/glycine betaine transport system ATPase subunit
MGERLKVTGLSKTKYLPDERGRPKPRRVLDDIHMSVNEGEVFVILGPTGSGKSTLLRMLNRLDVPDSGTVLLDGKNTEDWDVLDLRKRIGMVFQVPALFDGTVEEDILLGRKLRGETGQSMAAELASRVGLSAEFLHRSTKELSAGEKQKVAIARALANEPEILLMDEPSSAQDPSSKMNLEAIIREVTKAGLTVVMVTHDVQQAKRLANRVLLLIDGKGVAQGGADEVLTDNASALVKRFLNGNMEVDEQ